MRFSGFVLLTMLAGACAPSESRSAEPAAPAAPASGLGTVSGRASAGAIVALTPMAAGEFPLPAGHAVLDQYAKRFVPELLLARVGQPVDFLNSDDFGHNVIVNRRSTGGSVFTTSVDHGQKYTHAFERTGEYSVTCDLHEGMLAIIYVTTSPYSAIAEPSGAFTIPDVPPGPYTMVTVVPGGGTTERALEVTAGLQNLR